MYKILACGIYYLYFCLKPLKNILLLGTFGHISHCCHQPTCSQYFLFQSQKYGKKGFYRGLKRILTCHQ